MSWCLGGAGPLAGTPGWGWLQSQLSGARVAFWLAMARSRAAAQSCTGSFSLPSSGLATLGLLLWMCQVCPVATLLHAVWREQGAGTGFLSLGSPGWGQPSWTCLEHTPVVGRWELPPHLALFLSEDKSAVLFNLGSHQRALDWPVLGSILQQAPLLPALPDLPLVRQLQNKMWRSLSCGSGWGFSAGKD